MLAGDDAGDAYRAFFAPTRLWLERAVIGLNLCPFAKAVHAKGRIRWALSDAHDEDELLADLDAELRLLHASDEAVTETTLLLWRDPGLLRDFLAYNDFLDRADARLVRLALEQEIQVASFHPDYRFAGSDAGDVANASNRSPLPMLHLLRQSSVDRAVAAFPDAAEIYERNIETLRALGPEGLRRVLAGNG